MPGCRNVRRLGATPRGALAPALEAWSSLDRAPHGATSQASRASLQRHRKTAPNAT